MYVTKRESYGQVNGEKLTLADSIKRVWHGRVRIARLARPSRACLECGRVIGSGKRYLGFAEERGRDRVYCWPCATVQPHRWPCRELDRAIAGDAI